MPRRHRGSRQPPAALHQPPPPRGALSVVPTQWIYGNHAVEAALGNPKRRCLRILCLRENADAVAALLAKARAAKPAAPEIVERRVFDAVLPAGAVHQGVAVETEKLAAIDLEDVLADIPDAGAPHILVLLDQVTDPHNVGAILRSAAAFNALAVVVPEHGAPDVTGALAKAASGAIEAVPLLRVVNLARTIERVKEAGFWCVGLDSEAQQDLGKIDLPDRIALVLGAEGAGLRRLVRENCDYLARLPMRGALHSLNVSNAAAVALYALTQKSD
jgi:23S rRNA (guanosine2251-2'-O)-methyltransferase